MAIVVFVIFDIIVVAIVLGLLFKFLDIKIPYKLVETVNKSPKLKAVLDKIMVFIRDLDLKNKISNLKLPKIELPKRKIKTKPISVNSNDIKQDIANYFNKKKDNRSINPDTHDHPRFGRVGNNTEPVRNNDQRDYIPNNSIPSMNQRLVTVESSSYSGNFSMESNQKYDNDSSISTKKFTPWALSNNSDDDSYQELLNKKMPEQDSRRVESPYGDRINHDQTRDEGIKGKLFQRDIKEDDKKEKVTKEVTKKEKVKKEKSLFGGNKTQNKKYKIVQTGYASIFVSRNNNIIIIPYAKDTEGKGRAMDNIIYIDGPILPHQLGEAVRQAVEIDSNVYPFTDKELVKKLEVKEWSEFTQGRRYISVRYDVECGYILNTTTRNPDGSYRLNCPGGIEKIVNMDATLTDLGDTIYHLLEKCKA